MDSHFSVCTCHHLIHVCMYICRTFWILLLQVCKPSIKGFLQTLQAYHIYICVVNICHTSSTRHSPSPGGSTSFQKASCEQVPTWKRHSDPLCSHITIRQSTQQRKDKAQQPSHQVIGSVTQIHSALRQDIACSNTKIYAQDSKKKVHASNAYRLCMYKNQW